MDVVGYSQLLINQQSDLLRDLNEIVRATPEVRVVDVEGKLIRLPTPTGWRWFFATTRKRLGVGGRRCAEESADLPLRMGMHP